jgi:hypothetical protein
LQGFVVAVQAVEHPSHAVQDRRGVG